MMTGHKTFGQGLLGSMDAMLDGLSPVNLDLMSLEGDYSGSTFIRTLLPTTIQPMFDLGFNRNFFGQSITKESFDESTPSSQLGKTNLFLQYYEQWLKLSTHGVEGMNLKAVQLILTHPAVEYLLESYTGGRGRFYINLLKIGTKFV